MQLKLKAAEILLYSPLQLRITDLPAMLKFSVTVDITSGHITLDTISCSNEGQQVIINKHMAAMMKDLRQHKAHACDQLFEVDADSQLCETQAQGPAATTRNLSPLQQEKQFPVRPSGRPSGQPRRVLFRASCVLDDQEVEDSFNQSDGDMFLTLRSTVRQPDLKGRPEDCNTRHSDSWFMRQWQDRLSRAECAKSDFLGIPTPESRSRAQTLDQLYGSLWPGKESALGIISGALVQTV